MSIKKHINESRTITKICDVITGIGVIVGGLFSLGCIVQSTQTLASSALLLTGLIGLVATFVWWFTSKLAFVGLQLLTDITELLHNQQSADQPPRPR